MGVSAEAGVLYGAHVQEYIREAFGKAGSHLYVSAVFVVVPAVVGGYVVRDAWKMYHAENRDQEKVGKLARWAQSVRVPGTMMYFKSIGSTYVRPYMVKIVMGVMTLMALASRAVVIPVYMSELDMIGTLETASNSLLKNACFGLLILALGTGALIVLSALIKGMRQHRRQIATEATDFSIPTAAEPAATAQLSPIGGLERIMLVTDNSEFSESATSEAIRLARRGLSKLHVLTVLPLADFETPLAQPVFKQEKSAALIRLNEIRKRAIGGVDCEILLGHGSDPFEEIVEQAEYSNKHGCHHYGTP